MASGRQTIKQRIALDGGKDIQEQLKALGETGEKAFEQIRKAALKADLAKFGDSLNKFGRDLATVGRRVALAFGVVTTAAGAAGAAMFSLAKSGAEAADETGKAAQKAGLQIEAYGRLAFAAEMAGVSQEEFLAGMARFNRELGEAAGGSENAAKKFQALGIRIKDANGKLRPSEAILHDLAQAFSRMPDGALKSAAAIELFGRSGANLLPFLNAGAEGLRELGRRAEELGIVFTEEQFQIGDALGDALDEVATAVKAIRNQLGLLFAPILTVAAEEFRDALIANRETILAFGRTLTLYGIRLVRDFLNALFGNDAAVRQPWILKWRDAFIQFGQDVSAVYSNVLVPIFTAVRDAARLVADAINQIFGTNLTAGELVIGATLLKLLGIFKLVGSGARLLIDGIKLIGSAFAFAFSGGVLSAMSRFWSVLVRGALAFVPLVAGIIGWPALLVAGVVAAGTAIVMFWDDIVAGARRAIEFIQNFFSAESFAGFLAGVSQAAANVGSLLVDAFALAFRGIVALAEANLTAIAGFFTGIVDRALELATSLLPAWEQITAGAADVWQSVSDGATASFGFVAEQAAVLSSLLQPAWDAISSAAGGVWTAFSNAATGAVDLVVSVLTGAVSRVTEVVGSIVSAVFSAFTSATSEVVTAAAQIQEAISKATEIAGDVVGAEALAAALVAPFAAASGEIDTLLAALPGLAAAAAAGIASSFDGLRNTLSRVFASVVSAIRSQLASLESAVRSLVSRLEGELRRLRAAIAAARSAASSGSSSSGSAPKLAGGGHVRGPGSKTSDSIPAWLSDGEYVIRAAAVDKYGSGIFAALNQMRLPRDFLKALRGFNMGGLVNSIASVSAPLRMANGGLVPELSAPTTSARMRPIMFQLPGGDIIEGIMASNDAVGQMSRYASSRAMTSAGRKPGWRT